MPQRSAPSDGEPVSHDGWTFARTDSGIVIVQSPSGEVLNLHADQWDGIVSHLSPAPSGDGPALSERDHARFWSKVGVPGSNGCMSWLAGVDSNGYGQFRRGKRCLKAHQVSWWFAYGPPGPGLVLDHLCRNRRCVCPDHLEPVTQAENNRRIGERSSACRRGHPWAEQSPRINSKGQRECRICRRARARAKYREAKTA